MPHTPLSPFPPSPASSPCDRRSQVSPERSGATARSPLSIADVSFRLLVTGPEPLALPRTELTPTPTSASGSAAASESAMVGAGRGVIALDELRDLLRQPDTTVGLKNVAWSALVARSQSLGGAWTVGAVGVALPRLVRLASSLASGAGPNTDGGGGAGGGFVRIIGDARVELDAEILAGFLTGLGGANAAKAGLFPHLLRCARRGGLAWLRHQRGADTPLAAAGFESMPPPAPAGHPDLVLARAVNAGVLSVDEARLVGTTRIEHISVTALAARLGVEVETLWKKRRRAETRLAAYLHDLAQASDPDERDTDPTSALALADTQIDTAADTGRRRVDGSNHKDGRGGTQRGPGRRAGRASRAGHGLDERQVARERRAARRAATRDAARNAAARKAARRGGQRACPETGPTAPSYRRGTSPATPARQNTDPATVVSGRGPRGHASVRTSR